MALCLGVLREDQLFTIKRIQNKRAKKKLHHCTPSYHCQTVSHCRFLFLFFLLAFEKLWAYLVNLFQNSFKFSKMKNGGFQAMSLYLVPVIRKIDLNFYYTVFWEQPVCVMFSFSALDGIFVNIRLQFYYIIFIFSLFYWIFIPLIPSLSLKRSWAK